MFDLIVFCLWLVGYFRWYSVMVIDDVRIQLSTILSKLRWLKFLKLK